MAELSAVPFSALPQAGDGYTVLYESNQVCRSEKKLSELVGDKTSSFLTREQGDSLYQEKGNYLVADDITGKLDKAQYAVDSATFLTAHQDISNKLDTTAFSTVSSNFLTAHQNLDEYATQEWVNNQGFLKEHQPISADEWNDVYETVVSNSGTWETETDWTNDINKASAYAYEQAIAQIPEPFDPTFLSGEIDKKLDKTFSSNFYPMTGNPSGFLTTHQDISNKLDETAFSTVSSNFLTAHQSHDDYATINYVDTEIGKIGSFEVVGLNEENEPDVNEPSTKIIYLTKEIDSEKTDPYAEWIYNNTTSAWECIGETTLDLSNYQEKVNAGTDLILSELTIGVNTDGTIADSALMSFVAGSATYVSGKGAIALGIGASAINNGAIALGLSTSAVNAGSLAVGYSTTANGAYSVAEGSMTLTNGMGSHAEGLSTKAFGEGSHAEGGSTSSYNISHAEGSNTLASGTGAHSEGSMTKAYDTSHAEGTMTTASGIGSHAEGGYIKAYGYYAHAEGSNTYVSSTNGGAHAEGYGTSAVTEYGSHSEGWNSIASGWAAHAEGIGTSALSSSTHSEGSATRAVSAYAHAEGCGTTANYGSHSEGYLTYASGNYSHTEGRNTSANSDNSHAEGLSSRTISGFTASHAEGYNTTASGNGSHSEGRVTLAQNEAAHAEGYYTSANGYGAHSEGNYTSAYGQGTHAEGEYTKALGTVSHAEGNYTSAIGYASHSEGYNTSAVGSAAHAEGISTSAIGDYSHAGGYHTIANNSAQFVCGKYNDDVENSLFLIGNGEDTSARSNAFIVTNEGLASATKLATSAGELANVVVTGEFPEDKTEATYTIKVATDGTIYVITGTN